MKLVTLLFLRRTHEVLLAMKKRGTGEGYWNGVGGKVDEGESIEAATIRECQEEIGVLPVGLEKVAIIDFQIPSREFHNVAHVYVCTEWEGEPVETEEMAPKWFTLDAIPYDSMWADDRHWLPLILAGQKIDAAFTFDDKDQVVSQTIKPLQERIQ